MKSSKNTGFSLLEILIGIVLLLILSLASYLVVPKLISKAYDSRRKADLQKISIYLENYYNDKGAFPKKLPDCSASFVFAGNSNLPSFPCDPVTKQPYYYDVKTGEPQSYRVYTLLTNNDDNSIEKVGCLGGCGLDCAYNYGVSSSNINLTRCSYVCAPGGGKTGSCELYNDPVVSLCPKVYAKDPTCNKECSIPKNRCGNASGKHVPY